MGKLCPTTSCTTKYKIPNLTPAKFAELEQTFADARTVTFNASGFDKRDEAENAALREGYNNYIWDGKLYTIGGKSIDAATALYGEDMKNFTFDGSKFASVEEAAAAAYKAGFNTVDFGGKIYNIPHR